MGIVWVLGAGFSKPLGGPLLGKLLSPAAREDLRVRYADVTPLWGYAAEAARMLYRYGWTGTNGPIRFANSLSIEGEHLWEDAEEYLDQLDTAARAGGPGRDRLIAILDYAAFALNEHIIRDGDTLLRDISAAARRLLAAECCAFLEGATPKAERWAPYRRWLKEIVAHDDVLITFNYDMVVETIAQATGRRVYYNTSPKTGLALLKLHGSVSWALRGSPPTIEVTGDPRAALVCPNSELAIAGPGPSKQELSGGVFKDQWEQAISVLEFATAVVFVGYRFPPTDAEARQRLLGALRNNAREKHLPVHVVLGPRTGDDDPRRLTGLIEHAMAGKRIRRPWRLVDQSGARSYDISLQPLWAQDFFSVVERESILRPE